jgi:uncharacterized protein (TIGR03437 family)
MTQVLVALKSNISRRTCCLAALIVCLAIIELLSSPDNKPISKHSAPLPELCGEAAVESLKQQGLYSSLAEAMLAARYQYVWETRPLLDGIGPAWHAPNGAQGFHSYFTREGATVAEFSERGDETPGIPRNPKWQVGFKLKSYGYGERREILSLRNVEARQNRVEYTHYTDAAPSATAINEWYLNQAQGLEQGFTINAPPNQVSDGHPLRLTMEISGDLLAELSADGQSISLRDTRNQTSLNYRNLKAWDARGHEAPARMRLEGNVLALEVDDSGAVYPLTIDPLLTQQAKLTASDGAANDLFGSAVAISGDTVVVGAFLDDVGPNVDQGSAYVFVCGGCPAIILNPATLPNGAAGSAYTQSLTASGVAGPFRFFLSTGSIPPGLTLSQDGRISGTPGVAGTYNFTITATTDKLCAGSRSYTLVINCTALTVSVVQGSLPVGTVGLAYSRTFAAVGGAAPYTFSVTSGSLPTGLSLAPATGVLSGVPTANGTFTFTVRARDVNNCEGSQTFTLTIGTTGAAVRVVRVATGIGGAPGNPVAVPIQLVSQGGENALGLSLNFDPALLSNPRLSAGVNVPTGASLNLNTSQAAAGRVGLTLALQSNASFTAGALEAFVVTFDIAADVPASTTTIGFGDQPVRREVVSPTVSLIPANYISGAVTITPGLEGDVAPRLPNVDGTVTVLDWVQIGRFAAGIDSVAPGSELQRADCAPRDMKGDGRVTALDVTQAGRYAAGLDPLIPVGGPSTPVNSSAIAGMGWEPFSRNPAFANSEAEPSRLAIINSTPESGAVTLAPDARGDENAISLSLIFNPSQWRYVSAGNGADANDAMLQINTNQASRGRLGLLLALPAGRTFAAGRRQLIALNFAPATGGGQPQALAIGFADAPVEREVASSDWTAPLFFVSPEQINYLVPPETSDGVASVEIIHGGNTMALGVSEIAGVSPALFTADGSGSGPPAAALLRIDPAGAASYEAIASLDPATNRFALLPISFGAEGEEIFLLLYGTGVRGRSHLDAVRCAIGEVGAEVTYAGEAPGYAGLDQLNVRLPRALAGRGEVYLELRVDGKTANRVRVSFQ